MNVYEAWNMGYTGSGVIVGVLDTGVDVDHEDLVNNYVCTHVSSYIRVPFNYNRVSFKNGIQSVNCHNKYNLII